MMKFTIMWENQARGKAGVADERDLMVNLLPFWIRNYFKHPSYLKIDRNGGHLGDARSRAAMARRASESGTGESKSLDGPAGSPPVGGLH